jgi:hypothetical protein
MGYLVDAISLIPYFSISKVHIAPIYLRLRQYCSTQLWRCQGEDYWGSRQGTRWLHMERSHYVGSGRCSGGSDFWYSCSLRGEGLLTLPT